LEHNLDARVPSEVMDEINERLKEKRLPLRKEHYWICKLRKGAFPTKLNELIIERKNIENCQDASMKNLLRINNN
jgi:hypothetical protein